MELNNGLCFIAGMVVGWFITSIVSYTSNIDIKRVTRFLQGLKKHRTRVRMNSNQPPTKQYKQDQQ